MTMALISVLATLALVLAVILVAGWALHRKFDRHLAS